MERNIINQVVEQFVQLSEQYSPWEYSDTLSEFPNYPILLTEEISAGNTECIINTLNDFADMAENSADYQRIQSLIDRIRNINSAAA